MWEIFKEVWLPGTIAIALGISIEIGEDIITMHITLLMIYLVNALQLLKRNTMMRV